MSYPNRIWRTVSYEVFSNRSGALSNHEVYTTLWKWNTNIVNAETMDEAKKLLEFEAHLSPTDKYWTRFGRALLTAGESRGALYFHKFRPDVWLWRDYCFRAETSLDAIDHVLTRQREGGV